MPTAGSVYCVVCKVNLNCREQYLDHLQGRTRRRKLRQGQSSVPSTAAPSEAGGEMPSTTAPSEAGNDIPSTAAPSEAGNDMDVDRGQIQ